MKIANIIRDVILPAACLLVTLTCAFLTYKLFALGQVGAAFSTLILTAMTAVFVVHDARRLFFTP